MDHVLISAISLHCLSISFGQYAYEFVPVLPMVAKVGILDTSHLQIAMHKWYRCRGVIQREMESNKEDEARKM